MPNTCVENCEPLPTEPIQIELTETDWDNVIADLD